MGLSWLENSTRLRHRNPLVKMAVGKGRPPRLSGPRAARSFGFGGFVLSGFRKTTKDVMAAVDMDKDAVPAAGEDGVRRRDFINIAAVSAGGVGALAFLYPLI